MLALLLARQGIDVTLLEMHRDLDRDFRGDTLHPGVLEILDQLGMAAEFLELPHARMQTLQFHSPDGNVTVADLSRLKSPFPFVTMVRQSQFLEFLVGKASQFPNFRLLTGTKVHALREESGTVRGVCARTLDGQEVEIEAPLTIATDGRYSTVRRLADMTIQPSAPGIDVLWFRIPRTADQHGGGFLGPGGYMIVLQRSDEWQVGYVIVKGSFPQKKAAGVEQLRAEFLRLAPGLADSVPHLTDWNQIKLLSVDAGCLKRWHRPGLLLIGDAAHVMSPVGGVGINIAIQDAVTAANLLTGPLQTGNVLDRDLRRVQKRRRWPVRLVQTLQAFDQKHLIEPALGTSGPYRLPLWLRTILRLPGLRDIPSYLLAFGGRRVRIDRHLLGDD
jgi:2-polyprenyl-6-methoxyphenol hydroxylase-like FAD-dependent oxidoreductase